MASGSRGGSPDESARTPWVIVAAGFHFRGGMDKANASLARFLAARGTPLYLVGHDFDAEFESAPTVTIERVSKPGSSFMLGEWLLGARGRKVARAVLARSPDARVVVNGGNCIWPDINWVHYVHRAWPASASGMPLWSSLKVRLQGLLARWREKAALQCARVMLANSERTRRDLIDHLGLAPERVYTVYLGSDYHSPASQEERVRARQWLGKDQSRPIVAFVGALGYDSRKGFDTLFAAWQQLCTDPLWDADLVVAGEGRGSAIWRDAVTAAGLTHRITMLGFTERVDQLLAAADLLVSPVRYESYGLNVQEALCRGVPAIVTASAGVAERYPAELRDLLLNDPQNARELAARLRAWRADMSQWRERIEPLAQMLRLRTWDAVSREIVEVAEGTAPTTRIGTAGIELQSVRN